MTTEPPEAGTLTRWQQWVLDQVLSDDFRGFRLRQRVKYPDCQKEAPMFNRRKNADGTPATGKHRKSSALPVAQGKHAREGRDKDAAPAPDPCAKGHDMGDPAYPGDGTAVMACKNCTHTERYVV